MELSAFVKPLARWWWLLLAALVLAAGSSYWYVRQQPPLYQAKATLMIGRVFEDPNPTGNELALGQQLSATYADLALRRQVREQTMAALGLSALPEYFARPLPNTQLLEIVVVDTDPVRAQAVANELANQLILQSPTAPQPEEQERQAFIAEQLTSLQTTIQQTQAEIAAKQAELDVAFGALEIGELQNDIAALQTKLGALQTNYSALLASTTAGAVNTIAVIEPAALPIAPTASGQAQLILVTSAMALALAVGTAYLLNYLDDTVRSSADVTSFDRLPMLPSIPKLPKKDGTALILSANAYGQPFTESFRMLRASLYAATANEASKVFLVTSSAPQEGKSVVAANLASVLAQGNKSVLLIDADLRRPMQHKLFDVPAASGLAELLVALQHGQLDVNELAKRAIHKLEPLSFGLLVAGADPSAAVGLLGSELMTSLISTVTPHVDYVIIDSPPILVAADALELSTKVDGVILVAGAGSISRRSLGQALRRLENVNANIVGLVVNRQRVDLEGYIRYYGNGEPT
jgi:polysaccharide biosynthesis transport protein